MRAVLPCLFAIGLVALGCSSTTNDDSSADTESDLGTNPSQESILEDIRAGALEHGVTNGWLVAGIAKVETQFYHCRPAHLYCAGPASADCGGGPVLAGGSDGTCAQGGIGLFQLDDGTQTETVASYKANGIDILSVKGNVKGGIEALLSKMKDSSCMKGFDSDAESTKWLNEVSLGGTAYGEYTGMLAHCYNGWETGAPGWTKEKAKYDAGIRAALKLHDQAWWASQ